MIEVNKKKKNLKNDFLYLRVYADKHLKIAVFYLYTGPKKKTLSVQRWTHRTLNETHIVPKVTGMTQSKCLLKILGRTS